MIAINETQEIPSIKWGGFDVGWANEATQDAFAEVSGQIQAFNRDLAAFKEKCGSLAGGEFAGDAQTIAVELREERLRLLSEAVRVMGCRTPLQGLVLRDFIPANAAAETRLREIEKQTRETLGKIYTGDGPYVLEKRVMDVPAVQAARNAFLYRPDVLHPRVWADFADELVQAKARAAAGALHAGGCAEVELAKVK
jgi:hypothetical protein